MSDARSKVTVRPRSKLQRVLGELGALYETPARPEIDVISQLTLLHLVWVTSDRQQALSMLRSYCGPHGRVEPPRLLAVKADELDPCPADRREEAVLRLRAVGEFASGALHGDDLDTRLRRDPSESRRLVSALPGLTAQRADHVLLSSGLLALVAPTTPALNVAVRLGYPGTSYEAVSRALDAELPGPDAVETAWLAHHLLDQHGRRVCTTPPTCGGCPVRGGCFYQGSGPDAASRLVTKG